MDELAALSFTGPVHAIVSLPAISGIAKDTVVNTWSFSSPSPNLVTNLVAFYNAIAPGASVAVNGYLSPSATRLAGGCLMQLYDLSGPISGTAPMGPPILTQTWTLTGGGGSAAPAELAAVLTMHAAYSSIPEHAPGARPRARYRGRVYIGPLALSTLSQDGTTKRAVLLSGTILSIAMAAKALLAAEPTWSVWSRKDRQLRAVVGGWVDDSFDIQRRRGEKAVARTNWP